MNKKVFSALVVFSLTGCQTIQNKNVSDFDQAFQLGDTYRNEIIIGKTHIPLLKGTQQLISVESKTTDNKYHGGGPSFGKKKSSIGKLIFANVKDGIIQNATMVHVSLFSYAELGWTLQRPCKREDTIHYVVNNKEQKNQDCWIVNHQRMSESKKAPSVLKNAYKYAADNNWVIPENMFGTNHVVTKGNDLVNIRYLFNPEAHGIAPPKHMDWSSSDWHRNRIHLFKEKKVFSEKVIAWGEKWHDLVASGLKGNSVANEAVKIQSPLRINELPQSRESNVISDKLQKLKELFDDGVLTGEDYQNAKNRLLESF